MGQCRVNEKPKKLKVLYIAGLGRNGGTLLDRIMGELDGFFSMGEFKFVWQKGMLANELCNCGKPFRECSFWTEVQERAFGGREPGDPVQAAGHGDREQTAEPGDPVQAAEHGDEQQTAGPSDPVQADGLGALGRAAEPVDPVQADAPGAAGRAAEPINATWAFEVSERIDRTRSLPSLLARSSSAAADRELRRYADLVGRLHFATAEVSGAGVLVNSSKFAAHALVLAEVPGLELYVLHLVRDSRAAAFSWTKTKRKPEVVTGEAFLKRQSAAATASQWIYRNLACALIRGRCHKYKLARYEDFAERPREFVGDLVRWIDAGEPELPFVDESTVRLGESHTQSGNPVRFEVGEIPIRIDDEWQTAMPTADKRLVTWLTWPLLMRYGYPLRPTEQR